MKNLNGWKRAGIVLSVLWAVGLYIAQRFTFDRAVPFWYNVDAERVLSYVVLPIAAAWLAGYAFAWVRKGFIRST